MPTLSFQDRDLSRTKARRPGLRGVSGVSFQSSGGSLWKEEMCKPCSLVNEPIRMGNL